MSFVRIVDSSRSNFGCDSSWDEFAPTGTTKKRSAYLCFLSIVSRCIIEIKMQLLNLIRLIFSVYAVMCLSLYSGNHNVRSLVDKKQLANSETEILFNRQWL